MNHIESWELSPEHEGYQPDVFNPNQIIRDNIIFCSLESNLNLYRKKETII